MTPWIKAYEIARERGVSPEEYEQRMWRCMNDGYVFSTPDEFMAAHNAEHNGQPAYFILSAVGGSGNVLARFMRYAPEPRPWVLWCRNNEDRLRVFSWDKLARKAGLQ